MSDKEIVSEFKVASIDNSDDRPKLISETGEVLYVPMSYYITMRIKVGTTIFTYSDGSTHADSYVPIVEL